MFLLAVWCRVFPSRVLVQVPVTLFFFPLAPANVLRKGMKIIQVLWSLLSMWEVQMLFGILSSNWNSSGKCSHLVTEPAIERSLCVSCSFSSPYLISHYSLPLSSSCLFPLNKWTHFRICAVKWAEVQWIF